MSTSQGLAVSPKSSSGTMAFTTLTNGGGSCVAADRTSSSSSTTTTNGVSGSNERKQNLFITHVDSLGPYLKISGQLNPDDMGVVRSQVQKMLTSCNAIDPSWPVSRQQALLLPGAMCLYKRINGATPADFEFVRSRITKVIPTTIPAATPTAQQTPPRVEIEIIDYGHNVTVASYELLFPQQPEQLANIPTMCSHHIVLGICEDWKKSQLDEISRMISNHTLDFSIIKEFNQFKFITMKWKEFNIDEFLIHQKNMGAPIANDLFFDNFAKFAKQQNQEKHQHQQQQQQAKQHVPTPAAAAALTNNNNTPNTNVINQKNINNNNNNYYNKNHNYPGGALPPQQQQQQQQPQNLMNSSNNNVAAGGISNHMEEEMAARRSLAARIQHLQHPQLQHLHHMQHAPAGQMSPHGNMQNLIISGHVQPRMPQSIGNLRSMMQGIHLQNNRIPYTGLYHHHQPQPAISPAAAAAGSYNGLTSVHTSTVPQYNVFTPRYQRPPPPHQHLLHLSPGIATTPLTHRPSPATFKSNNLQMAQVYDVSVSFVENGPFLFSVQLVTQQEDLTEMMNRIERVPLKQFSEKPMLGTACIARYSEDGQLYRALITAVQPTSCKVAYIDYGNAEMVNFRDLYEIPEEFLKFKAFAIRFTLSGHKDLEPIDDSLKKAFKDLVIYKNCKLKVMPLEGPPLVQYCELYLQEKNILHVLKQIQKTRLVYAKAEALQNNDIVEIRYIDSPRNFYVQKVDNIPVFEKLMDDMFLYYNKNQNVPNHLALGAPCIVKYDNEWYRAEVMRADSTAIIVRHVDFGYEQKVTKNLLSTIAEKHLMLPRQAVQCCLKGFENNELSKDLATTQFEMLAEESNRERRSFTVKVFRIQPDGVNLVNLCTKDLNVMKKLYKLSMPFEQYLTLEREDFNLNSNNLHPKPPLSAENGHKTPSIASDLTSVHSSKKGNILNSTTVQSDEQRATNNYNNNIYNKQAKQQQHRSSTTSYQSSEWDKQSSHSSSMTENRDSRSSSSEAKGQGQQQNQMQRKPNYYNNYPNHKQQQQQQQQQQQKNQQNSPSSNNSVASERRSTTSSYNNKMGPNTPPRFQNKQKNDQQQQQTKQQRPQNAPQGFSQQQQPIKNQQQQQQQHQPQLKQQPQQLPTSPLSPKQKSNKSNNNEASKASSDTSSVTSKKSQDSNSVQKESSTYNFVALNKPFPVKALETPCREDVIISWWISPHQFYTQLKSRSIEFEKFMKDIQQFYGKLPLQQMQIRVGSYVMARQRKDNIIYRARIVACNQMLRKYKVHFVDFGNQYTVTSEDMWPVEKRFSDFPVMTYLCGFDGIVSNYDHLYIIDRMEKYLPQGVTLQCEYIEKTIQNDFYFVNVKVNKVSLKETLGKEGLITEFCPELRLDLLAGQQIRAKISSIKDMLNFKIEFPFYGCDNSKHIEVLCSYDDVRFVKSNQDVAKKFKQFYVGKSCVFNIKDVNDNKVVLLRPLMPLLKDDIPSYICTEPIVLETFSVNIVFVPTAYRLYGQIVATEMEMAQLLDDMYNYYENEGTLLSSFDLEKVCAAKGSDGNWYRGRILSHLNPDGGPIEVYYIDYGNTEFVAKNHIKHLAEKFYLNKNAFGLEINLPIKTLSADGQHKHKNKKQSPNASPSSTTSSTANESDIAVINQLTSLTLDLKITVKCLEVKNNHLIADLIMPDGRNMIDILKEQKLIKSRDIDYMRKLLEKEKPNMLEYIECVDLTIEDEEEEQASATGERNKKVKQPSTPKKKKAAANTKDTIEKEQQVTEMKAVKDANAEHKTQQQQAAEPLKADKPKIVEKPSEDVKPVAMAVNESVAKEAPAVQQPAKEVAPEPVVDPYAEWEHGILAHCDNPAQFFIHPMDKIKDLQKLQENLQIVASSLPPLMRIINGAHCISMYSVDKQWYRAKILDAELMVLQFIDFGNTDCVTDTTDLKEMSVFPNVEPMCIPCALPIRPNGTLDWQDAANSTFNDSYNKILDYEFITQGEQQSIKSYLNLHIEGVNITEKLIKDGFAKPLELVESGEVCYISHVNGISDFYLQYEKNSKALELIEIYLANNQKLKNLEKFEKFKIVAAIFPDDEQWYRAKLLAHLPDGYEVLFIDYGNTSISPECREISRDIAELPPLSKRCALEVPVNCKSWSDAAEKKFMEIADTGETIFTVELREPSKDCAIVHLLIDGHNVNDDLEELCEKKPLPETSPEMNASFNNSTLHNSVCEAGCLYEALISHVNSPCDFYIQFAKDAIRLEDMIQSLNSLHMDTLTNPVRNLLCAAVYPEDKALYRARILEILPDKQYRVLFIDYGNEAVTTDIKILPQDLMDLKEFSMKCQLENYSKFSQFGSIATEIFNNLVNQCEGNVKVDVVGAEVGGDSQHPSVVKVFAANTQDNLCEQLNKQLGLDHNTQTSSRQDSGVVMTEEGMLKAATTCVISHAISPFQFYIQLKSNSSKMEQIAKALQNSKVIVECDVCKNPAVDIVCIAFAPEDERYYRGRIDRILGDCKGYEVFLLDYGNTVTTTEIRAMSEELRSMPSMALKCQLSDIPANVGEAILEERFATLLESHFGEMYDIEEDIVDKETGMHTVKLQANYKDLSEELQKAVAADANIEEVFSPLPELFECSIIHANSPQSFFVQLSDDVSALEKVTDVLLDAETDFEEFTDLCKGALCAAQFPEDLAYYRAQIVDVLDDKKCEVHYIDFGNNAITDQFRKLPEDLLELARFGKHCSLDASCPQTPEVQQQFLQFVDTKFSETFQIELLKTTDTLGIVRLFYQDKNIIQEIMQLIKEGGGGGGGESNKANVLT